MESSEHGIWHYSIARWPCLAVCWGHAHSSLILHLFPSHTSHSTLANGLTSDWCLAHSGDSTMHEV